MLIQWVHDHRARVVTRSFLQLAVMVSLAELMLLVSEAQVAQFGDCGLESAEASYQLRTTL